MWHWAVPGDARVPWTRAARIELPGWASVRKQEAVACHRSQIFPLGPEPGDAPVLAESDLGHFRRRYELVLRSPGRAFRRPTSPRCTGLRQTPGIWPSAGTSSANTP
jgi:hypothetical protein